MNRQEWQDLMASCRSMFPTQDIPPATADSWYMAAGQRWDSDMAMAGLIRLSKTLDRRLTLAAWTSAVELEGAKRRRVVVGAGRRGGAGRLGDALEGPLPAGGSRARPVTTRCACSSASCSRTA